MDFFKKRLNIYKKVTGMGYTELALHMKVPVANLHRFLNANTKAIPETLQDNFEYLLRVVKLNMQKLDQLTSEPVSTLWPELFMPRVDNVTFLFSIDRMWHYTTDQRIPQQVGTTWCVPTNTGVETLRYFPFTNLFAPYWPIDEHYSVLKQSLLGWEKVNEMPESFNGIKKNYAKYHIPGAGL